MAGEDPACGSNPGDINMQATHVDAIVEAPSDGGSIPPASILMPAVSHGRYLPTEHMPCWQNVPGGQWLFDVHGGSSVR